MDDQKKSHIHQLQRGHARYRMPFFTFVSKTYASILNILIIPQYINRLVWNKKSFEKIFQISVFCMVCLLWCAL